MRDDFKKLRSEKVYTIFFHHCFYNTKFAFLVMKPGKFDEEGLLKEMEISELALKISKLTFGWKNHTNPEKESQTLLNRVRKLSLEVSDYEHRMGTNLSEYQRNKIYNSMEDLQNLIPYMKNKIISYESSENILNEDK